MTFDLNGDWTAVKADTRVDENRGRQFFSNIAKLKSILLKEVSDENYESAFNAIKQCQGFVADVRNNIFHGSKSLGETFEVNQKRRLEVYEAFLRSLMSLFFLAVQGRSDVCVAADVAQVPLALHWPSGSPVRFGPSKLIQLVAKGFMKQEDSRLLSVLIAKEFYSASEWRPTGALFYPSAGSDYVTPLLVGFPYCNDFYFYDTQKTCTREKKLKDAAKIAFRGSFEWKLEKEHDGTFSLSLNGENRTIYLVSEDNERFLSRDVALSFYFHRGDSWGEGGSGQQWDSVLIKRLLMMIPEGESCRVLVDGEPGGVHPNLEPNMEKLSITGFSRQRQYWFAALDREVSTTLHSE